MNISNLINYFTSADSAGKDISKIDSFLEYNMLGQFLNGNISASDGEKRYMVTDIESSDKKQLQVLYKNVAEKYNNIISTKEILITNDNAKQYSKLLTDFEKSARQSDSTDLQNMNKIKQALYQYVLDSKYDIDGLEMDDINYDFVINEILRKNREATKESEYESNAVDSEAINQKNKKYDSTIDKCMAETDIDTLMRTPKEGMYAKNSKGMTILYSRGYYKCPDYPDIEGEKNIYGLNFNLNQEFVAQIEQDLSSVLNSEKSDAEKKEYVADFVNKFKNWAYNSNKDFLYNNGIEPGTKQHARIGGFSLPFIVGKNYQPQFDIESIYKSLQEKYTKSVSD